MGNCLFSCLRKSETGGICDFSMFRKKDSLDFAFLVEDGGSAIEQHRSKRGFLSRFLKKHKERKKKPVLEFVDNLLNSQGTNYNRLSESQRLPSTSSCTSKDIQLQCLDARALLARTTTSTPENSLDLEWEHETLPISIAQDPSGSSWTALPEDYSFANCPTTESPRQTSVAQNSDSDFSRVSSANSLEWDNAQSSIHVSPPVSEIDTDTQLLLSEIERLTNKTLEETGIELMR